MVDAAPQDQEPEPEPEQEQEDVLEMEDTRVIVVRVSAGCLLIFLTDLDDSCPDPPRPLLRSSSITKGIRWGMRCGLQL